MAGIDKFRKYADQRRLNIKEETYGIYRLKHNGGKPTEREAVRATKNKDGELQKGWIINMGGCERSFKPDGSGYNIFPLK